jgi:LysR family transcriptional regulator for metE and metH
VVDLEEDLRGFASGRRGTLRLTTECYTCYEWLPPLLRRFEKRHPQVEVEIVVEATREAVAALRGGRVDLALVTGASGGDLVSDDLFEDELLLIVQPSHRLARRRFVRPADLLEERLLLYSKPAENQFYQGFLAPVGVTPREVSSVQLTEAIVSMVRAGLGVSPLAGWAVERELRRGEVVGLSIGERGMHRTWRAATRHDARRPAYLDDFVALIAEFAAPTKIERRRLERRR